MEIRRHRSPDGGDFPGDIHRLAAGGYLSRSNLRRQHPQIRSHRSPDGGDFPGDVHRLAAGGYFSRSNLRGRRPPLGSRWLPFAL